MYKRKIYTSGKIEIKNKFYQHNINECTKFTY